MSDSDKTATDEPEFDPPRIDCCKLGAGTGGAYHETACVNYPGEEQSRPAAGAKELRRTGIKRRGSRKGPIK